MIIPIAVRGASHSCYIIWCKAEGAMAIRTAIVLLVSTLNRLADAQPCFPRVTGLSSPRNDETVYVVPINNDA